MKGFRFRYSLLFFALLAMMFAPFLLPRQIEPVVMVIAFLFLMLAALAAAAETRRRFRIGTALALITVVVWSIPDGERLWLRVLSDVLSIAFFIYVASTVLAHVVRSSQIDIEMVFGSVCVYLFLALIWAFAYQLLTEIDAGALLRSGESLPLNEGWHVYFSFVTLTTLGYGDIAPVSAFARLLAVTEAFIGQLFLVVLVARVVGLYTGVVSARLEKASAKD